jgi:hypothetical protein
MTEKTSISPLVDRFRFRVVLSEVLLNELLQRQGAADTLPSSIGRVALGGEASSLKTS